MPQTMSQLNIQVEDKLNIAFKTALIQAKLPAKHVVSGFMQDYLDHPKKYKWLDKQAAELTVGRRKVEK